MANRWGDSGNSGWLYFGGLQNHCSWWLQPWYQKMLAPWKKSYDQPGKSIKKQRHYFPNKGLSSQSYGISSGHVWIWELDYQESWAPRIDAFQLWCWRRLSRVPWTARRSNQSVLKEISPEYSLEGLILKLKLQYFGHLMWRSDSLEKTLMLRKIEGGRRRGQQRMKWLDGTTQWTWVWINSGSWWWTGRPGVLQTMGSQTAGHSWATEPKGEISQYFRSCVLDIKVQRNLPAKYQGINTTQGGHKQDSLHAQWKFLDKISSNILFLMLWKRAGEEELGKENKVTRLKFLSCNEIGKI